MYAVRGGLGDIMPMNAANIDLCSGLAYYAFPPCWGYSRDAWQEAGSFALPASPVPPPAVASALSTVPAPLTIDEYNAELNASIAAGSAATKAAVQAGFDAQPTVCGSNETLNEDGVCVADPCTLLGIACSQVALWGALALVGVFGFVALAGGSSRRYGP